MTSSRSGENKQSPCGQGNQDHSPHLLLGFGELGPCFLGLIYLTSGSGLNEMKLQSGTGSGARLPAFKHVSQCLSLPVCKMGRILVVMG